jgi:hypothetical protein
MHQVCCSDTEVDMKVRRFEPKECTPPYIEYTEEDAPPGVDPVKWLESLDPIKDGLYNMWDLDITDLINGRAGVKDTGVVEDTDDTWRR